MFCHKCGAKLLPDAQYCVKCGTPIWKIQDSEPNSVPEPTKTLKGPDEAMPSRGNKNAGVVWSAIKPRKRLIAVLFVLILVVISAIAVAHYNKTRWFGEDGKPINLRVWNGEALDYDGWKYNTPELGKITDQCAKYMQPAEEGKAAQNYLNDSSDGHIVMIAWSSSGGYDNALLTGFGNDDNGMGPVFSCMSKAIGYSGDLQSALENLAIGGDGSLVVPYTLRLAHSVELTHKVIASCLPSMDGQPAYTYCMIGQNRFDSSSSQESDEQPESSNGDSSSESSSAIDHGTPDDAVGYDKYKDYNCFVGDTGAVAPCSSVYKTMKDGDVNYLPFGAENNPDPSNSSGYIPVDENQNGIRDSDE
ncbi:zinc ribbon domain-containing protein [Bifidobacterium saguinibicoloris]|uniref:zinc ribbon domain-containing protein n=1 Tax=Bifidobacterium saguinibicoloris TaxID=2834433 RepID=UPI001C58186D|nr:zinc ribbon domain-containing protein [Bifidobacterium saguinibicoloris]MBW3081593.1 zinc ribbon domain-containing protein [Bifidobacterium saguinibicoloris]